MSLTRKAPLSGSPPIRRPTMGGNPGFALGVGGLAVGASALVPSLIETSGQVATTAIIADSGKKALETVNTIVESPMFPYVVVAGAGLVALVLLR